MKKRETKAERDARVQQVLERLDQEYGTEYICYLNYETPWQLLIATMLSAQCTDARVNQVTADLFRKYDSLEKFAAADLKELEEAPSMTQPAARRVYQFFHGEPENEAPGGENTPILREKTAVPAQKPGKN